MVASSGVKRRAKVVERHQKNTKGQSLHRSIGKRTDAIFYYSSSTCPFLNERCQNRHHPVFYSLEEKIFIGSLGTQHSVGRLSCHSPSSLVSYAKFLCVWIERQTPGFKWRAPLRLSFFIHWVLLGPIIGWQENHAVDLTISEPHAHMGVSIQGNARFPWNVGPSLLF
jgi:hypothetical protein